MPLLDAIPFLKDAVRRNLSGGAPSTYVFFDGAMFAMNAAVLARYPMEHILGTFALAADDLEHALGRMPSEPTIAAGDGSLILKAGRLKSELTLMACEEPHGSPDGINDWRPPPIGLMSALRTATPFVSVDGSWQRTVRVEQGRVMAISNRSAIEVEVPDMEMDGCALTDDSLAYLAKLPDPQDMALTGGALWFRWPNTAWTRCQLAAIDWPDNGKIFDRIVDAAGEDTPIVITDEWREAFDDIASLGDGTLEVMPGHIHGKTEHAEHDAEFDTGVTRATKWSLKTLKPMFEVGATAWNPDAQGPATFIGPSIRGVVMAQR